MKDKTYMNAKELAAYLKLNVQTIYRKTWLKGEDRLPHIRVGHSIRFIKEVIDKWAGENSKT